MRQGRNIVLTGFMGVGKGAVARELGLILGRPVIDTDRLVEAMTGCTIPEIISGEGGDAFRRWERRAVRLASHTRKAVIATGGGSLSSPVSLRRLARQGVLIGLTASVEDILDRTGAGTSRAQTRPLLSGTDRQSAKIRIRSLLREREHLYRNAEAEFDNSARSPIATARAIVGWLKDRDYVPDFAGPGGGNHPWSPDLHATGYPVVCREDILDHSESLGTIPGLADARRAVLVTDPLVGEMYGRRVLEAARKIGLDVRVFYVPPGENAKKLKVAEGIYRFLVSERVGRDAVLLALGGGAVGDLVGFVAATYMRGIGYAHLPTTLLAQADSSLGGKTALNLPGHKNTIGAFHRPLGVVADVATLHTLPLVEIRSGLAEILKCGLILDRDLWQDGLAWGQAFLKGEENTGSSVEIVKRCMHHKAAVVEQDERELGPREILNFGHTLGHALEVLTPGYLRHGEAVSMGMDFAAWLGEKLGVSGRGIHQLVRSGLSSVGLPITPSPGLDLTQLVPNMMADKKARGGKIRFIFLREVGVVIPEAVIVSAPVLKDAIVQWAAGKPARPEGH